MASAHKLALFAVLGCVFAGTAVSSADTFYNISGVTSDTSATDYFPAGRLIEGAGTGFDAAAPHDRTSGLTWVTNAPNGGSGDYFNPIPSPAPRLVFDLGNDVLLSEISIWGYADGNGNGANQVSLRFATAAEGTGGFGSSISYNPTFYPTQPVTPRQSFAFTAPLVARYVELTPEDNFYGISPPGGDRVGLGEVAFATSQQVITPVGATSNNAGGTDLYPVSQLIDGSGLSATADITNIHVVTHAATTAGNSWVTDAPGGGSSDFYASTGDIPTLEFDLGGDFEVDAIVAWNYSIAGNAAADFTLEFLLDGSSVGTTSTLTFPQGAGPASMIHLGSSYTADTVRLTITDNYYGAGAGGDRVGLAEIRFIGAAVPEPATIGLVVLAGPILLHRRRQRG